MPAPDAESDARPNALLRRVDWRFLLRQSDTPRTLDLTAGRSSGGLRLAFGAMARESGNAGDGSANVDLVVLGYPTRGALARARRALRPGGEVVCRWWWPLPGGVGLARRRLARAGFIDASVYWPGPVPHRLPQFWLPLGVPAATEHVLAERPPRSILQALLRPIWRFAARLGALAPLCGIARAPGSADPSGSQDPIDALVPGSPSWLLVTGGRRSVNKVVGVPFADDRSKPQLVVKFARVPAADTGLKREAEALRHLERERPQVGGVPRIRDEFRRAGRTAVAETAVFGRPLLSVLTPATFDGHARRVTDWLIGLAGGEPRPVASWWPRLVGARLDDFEQRFGPVMAVGAAARARELLEGLGDLPEACEHRDLAPWNVVLTETGTPALLDWESSEPHGLAGLDLIYFLVNAAAVMNEPAHTRETYAGLLNGSSPFAEVTSRYLDEYSSLLGIEPGTMRRLRLLCWIIHALTYYDRLEVLTGGRPQIAALRGVMFLDLVEEELRLSP